MDWLLSFIVFTEAGEGCAYFTVCCPFLTCLIKLNVYVDQIGELGYVGMVEIWVCFVFLMSCLNIVCYTMS